MLLFPDVTFMIISFDYESFGIESGFLVYVLE